MPVEHPDLRKERMRKADTASGVRRQHAKATRPVLQHARSRIARTSAALLSFILFATLALALVACGGTANGSGPLGPSEGTTSGPAFQRPDLVLSPFDPEAAIEQNGALIDISHVQEGYVAASATSSSRLKFQVASDTYEYNYDLPSDGTPISCPLTAGDGTYTFTVWENTSGNRYVELASVADTQVTLADEFQPFIRPSIYCDYNAESASTKLANDLCADAQNQGDVVRAVYDWIVNNVAYDEPKAIELADATGYIPFPDATISDQDGICFDYASLAAAMLRSQGIPCKIVTGTVSPDNIYHAWNMVYIDGTWVDTYIDIESNTWTRIDTTFAAGGGSTYAGDGTNYTDRYTY